MRSRKDHYFSDSTEDEWWDFFEYTRSNTEPIELVDITCAVPSSTSAGVQTREIIHEFSTRFVAGELNLLYGPKGAGKTTMVRLLLDESPKELAIRGRIYFKNEERDQSTWKRHVSGTDLNETAFGEDTVKDFIIHESIRRMRVDEKYRNMEDKELEDKVNWRLGRLEELLQNVMNTLAMGQPINDATKGDQMAIGAIIAMIVQREVLVVDDPFEVLPWGRAEELMLALNRYAYASNSIVVLAVSGATRQTLFALADHLHIMCRGYQLYNGQSRDAYIFYHDALPSEYDPHPELNIPEISDENDRRAIMTFLKDSYWLFEKSVPQYQRENYTVLPRANTYAARTTTKASVTVMSLITENFKKTYLRRDITTFMSLLLIALPVIIFIIMTNIVDSVTNNPSILSWRIPTYFRSLSLEMENGMLDLSLRQSEQESAWRGNKMLSYDETFEYLRKTADPADLKFLKRSCRQNICSLFLYNYIYAHMFSIFFIFHLPFGMGETLFDPGPTHEKPALVVVAIFLSELFVHLFLTCVFIFVLMVRYGSELVLCPKVILFALGCTLSMTIYVCALSTVFCFILVFGKLIVTIGQPLASLGGLLNDLGRVMLNNLMEGEYAPYSILQSLVKSKELIPLSKGRVPLKRSLDIAKNMMFRLFFVLHPLYNLFIPLEHGKLQIIEQFVSDTIRSDLDVFRDTVLKYYLLTAGPTGAISGDFKLYKYLPTRGDEYSKDNLGHRIFLDALEKCDMNVFNFTVKPNLSEDKGKSISFEPLLGIEGLGKEGRRFEDCVVHALRTIDIKDTADLKRYMARHFIICNMIGNSVSSSTFHKFFRENFDYDDATKYSSALYIIPLGLTACYILAPLVTLLYGVLFFWLLHYDMRYTWRLKW